MERTAATPAAASMGVNADEAHDNSPRSTPLTFSGKPRPSIREKHLSVACLVFPRQDHMAFTARFEVFSRIPDVTVQVIAKTKDPVRDVKVSFSPPIRRPPRRLRWTSCSCRAVWESRH